jgi:dTMP kinase
MRQTYGRQLPGMRLTDMPGKLIVIEGTDGAGRSTQINLLKPWLEELGHAVLDTGMTRSRLAGDGIRRAKERNNLGRVTQSLFYATDFIDRLEKEIVPALRAGFIVLTDRYIYSLMARAIVRGMNPTWIRSIFSVALKPDAVFYLRIGIEQLLPRVVFRDGPLPRPGHLRRFLQLPGHAAGRIRPPRRGIQIRDRRRVGGCGGGLRSPQEKNPGSYRTGSRASSRSEAAELFR